MFITEVLETPQSIVITKKITYFKYMIVGVTLFQSVSLIVQIYDDSDALLKETAFDISGEDYANWVGDDNFILNYIKENLERLYFE